MSNIWFLLNKTNDAYEIDLSKPPQPQQQAEEDSPSKPKPQQPVTPYRPSFLPPTKKSLKRESLKRNLVVPSELMKMKQGSAALQLGIPASTFSKRWRESLPDRKWPFRTHRKLEKSMKMLLIMQKKGHNVTKDMERLRQQQEENLLPAVIHLYEEANDATLTFVSETPSHSPSPSPSSSFTPSTPSYSTPSTPSSYLPPKKRHSPSPPSSPSPPTSPPSAADVYSFVNTLYHDRHDNIR
eukprot:Phypoly_transcript_15747.p1 GENE.Phypoly_transcript_15747~~Phypoly_transcript_15747.p1  ORF type:complete len:240 (+),score=69.70 Phypoly_transcript_15747:154-873(+)